MTKKQQDDIFTGTQKLLDSTVKAYDKGGMALVLVIIGLIGFLFNFLFRSAMSTSTFVIMIIVTMVLFSVGVYIYLKEHSLL